MGEPIKLIIEFTADREGYVAEILPDAKEPAQDTVAISPEFGVTLGLMKCPAEFATSGVLFPRRNFPTYRSVLRSFSTIP
jgi:hypothetical protein